MIDLTKLFSKENIGWKLLALSCLFSILSFPIGVFPILAGYCALGSFLYALAVV